MSHPSYPRTRRLNAILLEVLAEQVELLTDPRLELVTLTGVEISPDMRNATVYYSTVNPEQLEPAGQGLAAAAGRLQGRIGQEMRIKYTPRLQFSPDRGVLEGEKIEHLLRNLDQPPEAPNDDQPNT